ncbi:hypothetical protein MAUB1S_00488 [Mycolicibacterium aubagnense]
MQGKFLLTVAAATLIAGSFNAAATAQAAQRSNDTTTYSPAPPTLVQPLDCHGTTGSFGCGPGWFWNGNRCVPC